MKSAPARPTGSRVEYVTTPVPPLAGDLEIAARTLGWPRIVAGLQTIARGEKPWRAFLALATPTQLAQAWEALPDTDEHGRPKFDASVYFDRVRPTEREQRTFNEALRFARTIATIPAFEHGWFRWYERAPYGVTFHTKRPVLILLQQGLDDWQLFKTTLHELQHVRDARYPDMKGEQREDRAETFTDTAVAIWNERQAWLTGQRW